MVAKQGLPGVRTAVSRRVVGGPPARSLADAVKLCDPWMPLNPVEDAALVADLSSQRGGDRLATVARTIRRSGGTPTLQFLTGHVGGGKTTELLRLQRSLSRVEGKLPAHEVLFLDADTMLDRNDIDLEDILVALWVLVQKTDRSAAIEVLREVWKTQLANTFGQLIRGLPGQAVDAIDRVQDYIRLQAPEERAKLRHGIAPILSALIHGLSQAFRKLPSDPEQTVVVLIDNLEKLSQGQAHAVERLYLERMGALKDLDAHLVITVPLDLCFSPAGASLGARYGGSVVLLPMIKVRKRAADGGGDDAIGIEALTDLLKLRVSFGTLFEGGEQAARDIARLSGGCIRHALRIVQSAVNEHDDPPVTRDSVRRAAATLMADFERSLPERWLGWLHQIDKNNDFPSDCEPEVKQEMLRHLYVLEYQNGEPEPWWAVHPLVRQSRKFREYAT